MKKIFLALMAGVLLVSCDLNFFPSDETNADALLQDAGGAAFILDGCYSILKDEVEFLGYASGNSFVRHYFQMAEFPADNCCLSSHTTDPLYEATALKMTDNLKNTGALWMLAYKVVFMTNSVIETLNEGESAEGDHLLGEAYFVRAWMHLSLVSLYSKPYTHGQNNLGVPLHIKTSIPEVTRASVGEVYEQIEKDLKKASELMSATSRGNKGYPNKNAALGLLSRVQLYMEKWDEVVNTVNAMLAGATPDSKLDKDLANLFINAKTADEVLFCVGHELTDTRGGSSIGSMYLKDGLGWGEIYPANPLLYLYERYPSDIRYKDFIRPQYLEGNNDITVYFPTSEAADSVSGFLNLSFKTTFDGTNYSFKDGNTVYTIEKRLVNGEYYEYHVNYKNEDCLARVHKTMENRNSHPIYYMSKYSYQDGDPMLSSPVVCRWAEVILNRAEAYAHLGQDANALADVNVIRTRAGIPAEGMFATGNMHGYASALDVVLDERRLELAFEGHRLFDLIRNKKDIDRKYAGAQPWEIVPYHDNRLQYPIPNNEWTVSGIQQNPGY